MYVCMKSPHRWKKNLYIFLPVHSLSRPFGKSLLQGSKKIPLKSDPFFNVLYIKSIGIKSGRRILFPVDEFFPRKEGWTGFNSIFTFLEPTVFRSVDSKASGFASSPSYTDLSFPLNDFAVSYIPLIFSGCRPIRSI